MDVNNRIYINNFIIDLLPFISGNLRDAMLPELGSISTTYGTYSYLVLMDKLKKIEIDETRPLISFENDTVILQADLEDTMKDINILVMSSNIKDKIEKWSQTLKNISLNLNLKYNCEIELSNKIVKKVFNTQSLTLYISSKKRLRGTEDSEAFNFEKYPLIVIDFCVLEDVDKYKPLLALPNPNYLQTLSKEGYKILLSYVYAETSIYDFPFNKKRDQNIMNLFTQNEALSTILLCNSLFNKNSTNVFLQFLEHFYIEIPTVFDSNDTRINFSKLKNFLNSVLLEEKSGKNNHSLRQYINTFISLTDQKLYQNNLGRIVKAGGEAVRYHTEEVLLVNDIDVKIFLDNPKNVTSRNEIYQNNLACLYELVKLMNEEEMLRMEKDLDFVFTFADKNFKCNIGNKDIPDCISILCKGTPYTFLALFIDIHIESMDMEIDFKNHDTIKINSLDISIEEKKIKKDTILVFNDIDRQSKKLPPILSQDYFLQDLTETLLKNPIDILSRYLKGKTEKDIKRRNLIMNKEEEEEDDALAEVIEKESLFRQILKYFGCKSCVRPMSHFGNKIIYVEMSNLDEKLDTDSALSTFFDIIWDKNWSSTYPHQLENDYLKGYINNYGCVCPINIKHKSECELTFSQFLKCSFTKLTEEQIKNFLSFINHDFNLYDMLILSTSLNSMEKSDRTVIINPFNKKMEIYPIHPNLDFNFIGTFKNTDKVILDWYTSDSGQYKVLNEKMRKGKLSELTFIEHFILEKLAEFIDKSRFTKDMILYRGISETNKDIIQQFKQSQQTNQFYSTTLDISIASIFQEKACCMFHIDAKKDMKGLYVPMFDQNSTESEVLLPPGIHLELKEIDRTGTIISYEYKNVIKEDIDKMEEEEKDEKEEMNQESVIDLEIERDIDINFFVDTFPHEIEQEMDIPDLSTKYQKLKFMREFEFESMNKNQLFTYFKRVIPFLNTRNSKYFDRKYERAFGNFMTKYFDKMGINIDPVLNSSLTVEKGSKSKLIPYSIRTILNEFIAATDKNLQKNDIGRLYKTGGESIRYYTQDFGDKITNDIDSKMCLYNYSTKNVKKIFPKIAKTMIYMAGQIATLDFSVNKPILVNDQLIGSISSKENENFIDDYITIRTNYVGKCYEDQDGSKNDKDCMIILSIDVNFKINIDNPLYGGPFYFYKKTAPYDFLISKNKCKLDDIQNREHNTEPPIVSLKFVINDLYHLLNPQGDLERRISTNKHQKDIKRYNSIMKTFGKNPSGNMLKDLKDLLVEIKPPEKLKNTEYITNVLDKPCKDIDYECSELIKTIDAVWEDETIEQRRINRFLGIDEGAMKYKISELEKIVDAEVYHKFFVNIK